MPIRFGEPSTAGPDSALLLEGDEPAPAGRLIARFVIRRPARAHPVGCVCCAPRGVAAEALSRLFLARARSEVGFFREVVVVSRTMAGRAAIHAALDHDPLVSSWFRAAPTE
ncbi:MAG TPA: hypothetical protein VFW75_10725 [Acetobacteraceae bacterium]|nr:hypothetical protein [Acetobacteraceae bacterium]